MTERQDPAKGPQDRSKKAHRRPPPEEMGKPGIDPDERGEVGQFTETAAPGQQKK